MKDSSGSYRPGSFGPWFLPATLAFMLFAAGTTSGQETDAVRFERLSRQDGLSNLSVSSIVQDRWGFLWLGTQGGLNRYDGYKFTVFESEPFNAASLTHNLVQTLHMERDVLWVGTYHGVNRLELATGAFSSYHNEADNLASLSNDIVTCIQRGSDGYLWIGTLDGLNRLDEATGTVTRFIADGHEGSVANKVIRDLMVDEYGVLWVGTMGGLCRYDSVRESFVSWKHQPGAQAGLPADYVMSMAIDAGGRFWLGVWGGGLVEFDRKVGTFATTTMPDPRIYSLIVRKDRSIWVGSWGGGLTVYNPTTSRVRQFLNRPEDPATLSNNIAYAMHEDSTGVFWVGTNGGGLNKIRPQQDQFLFHYPEKKSGTGLASGKVTALERAGDHKIWIGHYNTGLDLYDHTNGSWKHFEAQRGVPGALSNGIINSLLADADGTLWLGTNEGINRLDSVTGKFSTILPVPGKAGSIPDSVIFKVKRSPDGTLWAGTYTKGLAWQQSDGTWKNFEYHAVDPNSLSDNLVYDMWFVEQDSAWVATNNGLNRLNLKTGLSRRYFHDASNQASLSSDATRVLFRASSGDLWIGTSGGGLSRYNAQTDAFTHLTTKQGFSGNTVYGILEDSEGQLWVGTNSGLSRVDPKTGKIWNYGYNDGLPESEFSSGAVALGEHGLWFGNVGGLLKVNKTKFADKFAPAVRITDFSVFNQRVVRTSPVDRLADLYLDYDQSYFGFEFAAMDFASPGRNSFAYQLTGFEADWKYASVRNFASYTNVPPGDYVFRVKAAGSQGMWNETGASIRVHVKSHFALSPVAIVLYVTAFSGSFWLFLRMWSGYILKSRAHELLALKNTKQESSSRLLWLGAHDALTGFLNRITITDELRAIWSGEAGRTRAAYTLVLCRLANLDAYSSRQGYSACENLLIAFSNLLSRNVVNEASKFGRLSESDFLLVYHDPAGGAAIAAAFLSAVHAAYASLKPVAGGVLPQLQTSMLQAADDHAPDSTVALSILLAGLH